MGRQGPWLADRGVATGTPHGTGQAATGTGRGKEADGICSHNTTVTGSCDIGVGRTSATPDPLTFT